jgi:hypothetical protein
LGPTELLLGLLEFYSEFKDTNVIAPAKNPPFRTFEDLKEEIGEKVEDQSIISHIIHLYQDSYFKIQDPYDYTYNPARTVKNNSQNATKYQKLFEKFAKNIRAGKDVYSEFL